MSFLTKITQSTLVVASSLSLIACNAVASENEARSGSPVENLSENGLRQAPLTVTSKKAEHRFTVELARSVEEQARGLMFRTKLLPDEGMIFPFGTDRMASFWMKNTVIPLDIIFVRRDGTIESIAANTTPYSLDAVESGEPVAAVLEIAGGRAAELGIAAGDQVRW
ncbi:MAG: DUF192 domain-containing protein [Parasphingorhabdus sp.]